MDDARQAEPPVAVAVVVVDFDGPHDKTHPHNWSPARKAAFSGTVSATIFAISFASSLMGQASEALAAEFRGTSDTVASLDVSLFVLGFAVGPLVFGPLSEVVGHVRPFTAGVVLCAVFQVPLGLAPNMAAVLASRFLAGAFGSSVIGCGSGMMSECYDAIGRTSAIAVSSTMLNLGAAVAPMISANVVRTLGWRWLAWITLILIASMFPAWGLLLRESSPKIILDTKVARMRAEMVRQDAGSQPEKAIVSALQTEAITLRILARKYLFKSLQLLAVEPILLILSIHLTFAYGTLYLSYQIVPLAYQKRGWSATASTYPFVAVALGLVLSGVVIHIYTQTRYRQRWLARDRQTLPEDRLPPMILGAWCLPVSLLWFGWSFNVHWICQTIAAFFVGTSLQLIFTSGIMYIVDVYAHCANSAVASSASMRSLVAATFPIWTGPLYHSLGVEWMATALAVFSTILAIFPVLFLIYGRRIRSWSKNATFN